MNKPSFECTCTLFYVEKKYKKPEGYNIYKLKKPEGVQIKNDRVTVHWHDRILGLYRPNIYYNNGCFVLVINSKPLRVNILKLKNIVMCNTSAFTDVGCSAEFDILPNDPSIVDAVLSHEAYAKTQPVSYFKFFDPSTTTDEVKDFANFAFKKCNPALNATITLNELKNTWMQERQKMTRENAFTNNVCQTTHRAFGIPRITGIYYNDPHTAVKWNDGSITVVGCAEGETFSKELGLAVAIAKKYYEDLGYSHPRAALKRATERGVDQTAKTKARKKYKQNKKNSEKQE